MIKTENLWDFWLCAANWKRLFGEGETFDDNNNSRTCSSRLDENTFIIVNLELAKLLWIQQSDFVCISQKS